MLTTRNAPSDELETEHKEIQILEAQPLKIFPLNTPQVAIAIYKSSTDRFPDKPNTIQYSYSTTQYEYFHEESIDTSNQSNITMSVEKKQTGYTTQSHVNGYWTDKDYIPAVLPNGIFLHAAGDWRDEGCWVAPTYIINLSGRDSFGSQIYESIDPSTIACLSTKGARVQIACTAADKKKIYTYHLEACSYLTSYTYPQCKHLFEANETTFKVNSKNTKTLFESDNEYSIQSFAVLPDPHQPLMLIARDKGLDLGTITHDKFNPQKQLSFDSDDVDSTKLQLLSSASQKLFIAYAGGKNMRIWDAKNDFVASNCQFPALFNLCVSSSGNYLSAMADCGGDKSSLIYILDLREITATQIRVHTLKLNMPVNHFVIGYKDRVCLTEENKMVYMGEIKKFILKYHQQNIEEATAQLKHMLPPPPPIEIERLAKSWCGMFAKKKDFPIPVEKPKPVITYRL